MSQKQWPRGYKSKCHTQNQHLTDRQADSAAALYSSSWQQHFCTAGMKSCCSHTNSAQTPSWAKAESFLMETVLRVCLGIRLFLTWMEIRDAVKKSEQKKTGSIYAMIRTVIICEWNAQAEWNNIWEIIWKASWLNKERTEQLCIITRTGNSKNY